MVSIIKTDKVDNTEEGQRITGELRGLSTDNKPIEIDSKIIDNGSVFIEIDTGKMFFYDLDGKAWKEV